MADLELPCTAQDVVRCTLCDSAPAELNCNKCSIGLSGGCVSKHITSKKSQKHDIVPFTARKSQIQLPDCKAHPNIKCELHCRQCNVAICLKCVTGLHYKHDITEISDTIASMTMAIQQETEELDTVITEEYETIISDLKTKLVKIKNEYQNMKKSISDHGELWHKGLDVVISHFIEDVERNEKEDIATLNKKIAKMENILMDIKNTSMKNKQILKSKDSVQMFNHKCRKEEFCVVPTRLDLSPTTFKPIGIEVANLMKAFGTLTSSMKTELSEYNIKTKESISSLTSVSQLLDVSTKVTKLLDVPREITTTDASGDEGDQVYSMTTINSNQMWIGRPDGFIDHMNIHGKTQKTIETLSGYPPPGLTVTSEGHLIYTDGNDNTVNLVGKGKDKDKGKTVIRTGTWAPSSVCSTSTGDLLLCLTKESKHKVVRYSSFKAKQEMQFDEKKKALFAKGDINMCIAENRDQNICVSDPNAHTAVVLSHAGKLHFRYHGNLPSNKYKSFSPHGIATDSQSQILIADCDNNCVHIISHDGKFIRYIDNCHLKRPVRLSVDGSDHLFVSGSKSSSVKIIKYMK